jgi:hypothetical protein
VGAVTWSRSTPSPDDAELGAEQRSNDEAASRAATARDEAIDRAVDTPRDEEIGTAARETVAAPSVSTPSPTAVGGTTPPPPSRAPAPTASSASAPPDSHPPPTTAATIDPYATRR